MYLTIVFSRCFLSFPDSNTGLSEDSVFTFRIRKTSSKCYLREFRREHRKSNSLCFKKRMIPKRNNVVGMKTMQTRSTTDLCTLDNKKIQK